MGFLQKILNRPANERPFVLIPVGYPAAGAQVPKIAKKPLPEVLIRENRILTDHAKFRKFGPASLWWRDSAATILARVSISNRRAAWSIKPWTSGSLSSTPRIFMATKAARKSSSVRFWATGGRTSSWRRNSACRWKRRRKTAPPGGTSCPKWRTACGGSAPTGSICIKYTRPDPLTPIEETLRALDDLIHQGKVRYIGCSNLPAWRWWKPNGRPAISVESLYLLPGRIQSFWSRGFDRDLMPVMERHGLGLLPYFPLASGSFNRKIRRTILCPKARGSRRTKTLADRYLTDATGRKWNV